MSRRDVRRARRGGVLASAGTVPSALCSRNDPLWTDANAVERLVRAHGLVLKLSAPRLSGERDPTLAEAHPCQRFDAFRSAWCLAAGLEHPQHPGYLDLARCKATGVDTSSSRWDATGRGCLWAGTATNGDK